MAKTFVKLHPKKFLITSAFVAVVVMDIIFAIMYRTITGESFHSWPDPFTVYMFAPSEIYHHDLEKKVNTLIKFRSHFEGFTHRLTTNSLGFKDNDTNDVKLSVPNHRILFMGDSFTEGYGNEYKDTFVGIIDETLAKENIDVLNAGVGSYAPTVYWRKTKYLLEDVGLKFDEMVVFIDIADIHDEAYFYRIAENGSVRHLLADKVKPLIKRLVQDYSILSYIVLNYLHDTLLEIFRPKLTGGFIEEFNRHGVGFARSMWTVDEKLLEEFGRNGLRKAEYFMNKLANLLKKTRSIDLTIAVYPWPDQIINNDLDSIQVRFWSEWAKNNSVGFINYFPCFVAKEKSMNDRLATIERYYIPWDVHWSKNGHQLVASELLSIMNKKDPMCAKSFGG